MPQVRISEETHAIIARLAEVEDRSQHAIIRRALDAYLRAKAAAKENRS